MAEKKRLWDATPIQYNEDRYVEPQPRPAAAQPESRDASDIRELLSRPERRGDERTYECNDSTPVDYTRGPHDSEFGLDDRDEGAPIDYSKGPATEEAEDEDELEPLDDSDSHYNDAF